MVGLRFAYRHPTFETRMTRSIRHPGERGDPATSIGDLRGTKTLGSRVRGNDEQNSDDCSVDSFVTSTDARVGRSDQGHSMLWSRYE